MDATLEEAKIIRRGSVWLANFPEIGGSRVRGIRPTLIISNDLNNRYSTTIQAIPLTSNVNKKLLPVHVLLTVAEGGLERDSIIMCEQSCPLNKTDLISHITNLNREIMKQVEQCILIHNGIQI